MMRECRLYVPNERSFSAMKLLSLGIGKPTRVVNKFLDPGEPQIACIVRIARVVEHAGANEQKPNGIASPDHWEEYLLSESNATHEARRPPLRTSGAPSSYAKAAEEEEEEAGGPAAIGRGPNGFRLAAFCLVPKDLKV